MENQKIKVVAVLVLMISGFIITALPDEGSRLFSLSENHGPSFMDMIGIVLMILPYSYLVVLAHRNRARFRKYENSLAFKSGLFLLGAGFGLLVASVFNNYSNWWIYGVVVLVVAQIPMLYITLR